MPAKKNNTATTTEEKPLTEEQKPLPATNTTANAKGMAEMQKEMELLKRKMADATGAEILIVFQRAVDTASDNTEIPNAISAFLQAKMASAVFMSLRDELVGAYMRNEASQIDKAILIQRKEEKSFRSDVEEAGADRSLAYYENLEERLQEIEELISQVVATHTAAAEQMYREDISRQEGVPEAERVYQTVPSLRWISAADRNADPKGCEETNDLTRLVKQAEFWLSYNS